MARALYREWFVEFRFPGHEKIIRVASALGDIPKGWDVKPLPECVVVNPRVAVPREGEKPFVPMGWRRIVQRLFSSLRGRVPPDSQDLRPALVPRAV
ncbi:MAG TPA: hypothetical protein VM818_02365 [Vicinamibacterales bacterium]|jgi:type I restriction enzyme S subunit|nr:hypothetical protein [Vicinamibacterales bacterium]